MKFKEYLEACNKLAKEHPECLEFPAVYANDPESDYFSDLELLPELYQLDKDKEIMIFGTKYNTVVIN